MVGMEMEIGVKGSRCFSIRSGAFTPFTPTVSAYLPLISPIYMFSRAFFPAPFAYDRRNVDR